MGDFAQSSPAATNNLRDTLRLRVLAVKAADNAPSALPGRSRQNVNLFLRRALRSFTLR